MWSRWAAIGVPQGGDAGAVGAHRGHDRHGPVVAHRRSRLGGQLQHLLQVAARLVDAGPVGLVDGEHVGDLHQAGLARLHAVTPPRVDDHDRRVGLAGDLDLDLADADGLDEDPAVPEGVEQADRLRRGQGQPAEVAAGGHRADEHAGVGGVVLHADPVAEDRPAGERRRGVDSEHGDLLAEGPQVAHERRRERALAGARRAGHTERVGLPGQRRRQPADLAGVLAAALDERQQTGLGRAVTVGGGGEELPGDGSVDTTSASSAMSTTWVTPSTRSRMIRSMPAFSVWVDAGSRRRRR